MTKPEQIVQKLAERLMNRVNFKSAKETEIKFLAELKPLADLIRAAEDLLTEDMCNGIYHDCPDSKKLAQARTQSRYPIQLNHNQETLCRQWAADDRLWTTQETVEFNLKTFARSILVAGEARTQPAPRTPTYEKLAKFLKDNKVAGANTIAARLLEQFFTALPEATKKGNMTETLGQFGHHPDMQIDAQVEVERLGGLLTEAHGGLLRALDFNGVTPRSISIKNDVRNALERTGYKLAPAATWP